MFSYKKNFTDAWGDDGAADGGPSGFEAEAFDPFLSMGAPPPPAATPRLETQGSRDSTDDTFSVFIRSLSPFISDTYSDIIRKSRKSGSHTKGSVQKLKSRAFSENLA